LITDARKVGVDRFRINERGLEGYVVAESFRSRVNRNSMNFAEGQVQIESGGVSAGSRLVNGHPK
jgi:hypothetical protein